MIVLHHVQVSCPAGGEDVARRFWADGVGLTEVTKPDALAGRGGAWFRGYDGGRVTAEIHVGVDDPFIPANKAHPALVLGSVVALEGTGQRLLDLGFEVSWAERDSFEGFVRFHARDGHGNRVEIMSRPD